MCVCNDDDWLMCVIVCVTLPKVKPDPSHAEWIGHGGQCHCEVAAETNMNPFKRKHKHTWSRTKRVQ